MRMGWVVLFAVAATLRAQEPSEKNLAQLKAFIAAKPEEQRWRAIRWYPALWPAVQAAHTQKRPLLIWAMNGHPLGCT